MARWPNPRILMYGALALGAIGTMLLYTGFLKLAPLFILGFVVCCILAMIATTALSVENARLQLDTLEENSTYDE